MGASCSTIARRELEEAEPHRPYLAQLQKLQARMKQCRTIHQEANMRATKLTLLMLFFLGTLGIAGAQSSGAPVALGSSTRASGQANASGAFPEAVSVGWNYKHGSACTTFSNTFVFYAWEDGSSFITNNITTIATLTSACQSGNLVAFHVFDLSGELGSDISFSV
jgi:hypothetical protein